MNIWKKDKPPLGYRRTFKLRRSEKMLVVGLILVSIGARLFLSATEARSGALDLLGLRVAQQSPIHVILTAINSSWYARTGALIATLGVVFFGMWFVTRLDERHGKIEIPPQYEKKR